MRIIDFLCNSRNPDFTFITLSTTSWMVPLAVPSWDMERRRVSMAWWLEQPSRDSPFTATSWSLTHNRPSCRRTNKGDHTVAATGDDRFCWFVCLHQQIRTLNTVRTTKGCFNMLNMLWSPLALRSVFLFLTAHCFYLCSFEGRLTIFHLVRSASVDNGFDEDPQVLPGLPGLVSFEADAQPRRAAVIKRHLERELLLSVLGNKARHAGHFVLLGVGETVMGVEVEKETLMRKRGSRT